MQDAPRAASHPEVSCMFAAIFCHISRNWEPLAEMPRISLICDVTIIRATADVKPELTGPDTKSIKKPGTRKGTLYFLHPQRSLFRLFIPQIYLCILGTGVVGWFRELIAILTNYRNIHLPRPNIPIISSTTPAIKHNKIAWGTGSSKWDTVW